MRKYRQIFTNSLSEYFIYRTNFILWRTRVILNMLITYYLWSSVYLSSSSVFGYGQSQMLTYVLLLILINGFVLSTQSLKIGEEINWGVLSGYLVRPLNYISYYLVRDLADKSVNLIFSVLEIFILLSVLKPPVIIQTNFYWLFIFTLSLLSACMLYFEISLVLSFLGFWIHDTWPTRFVFFILISFLAGNYFPLDILPTGVFHLLTFSPFTYLIYFPLKIYLGQLSPTAVYSGFIINAIWLWLIYLLLRYMWMKGLKSYSAVGQ